MSVTFKGRRAKYDNVAVGGVTGNERHISGSSGGEAGKTTYGGVERTRDVNGASAAIGIESFIAGSGAVQTNERP